MPKRAKRSERKAARRGPPPLSDGECVSRLMESTDVDEIVELSAHSSARVRKAALKEMCPCRVKLDVEKFWDRVLDMVDDDDDDVRATVLHVMCDGSPARLEHDIVAKLEYMSTSEAVKDTRKKAKRVLEIYNGTGKWNVL